MATTTKSRSFQQSSQLINSICLFLALGWLVIIRFTLTPATDDFKQYWQAAINFWQTGNPYIAAPGQAIVHTGFYYLPIFAYITQPIARFDQVSGQVFWYWLNVIALFAFVWLCISVSGSVLARRYWGVVLLAMCLAPPTRVNLQLGQISIFVAIFLIGCFALAQQRPRFAGFLLALASLFRIYPVLLGGYFVLQRNWQITLWAFLSGVVLLGLSLVYGIGPYVSFIQLAITPTTEYPFAAQHNISLYGVFTRLFVENRFTAAPLVHAPWIIRPLTLISSLVVVWLLFLALRTQRSINPQLAYGLALCGMMLLSSTNGYYTFVLLLFPLLALLALLEQNADRNLRNLLLIATALICVPPGWTNFHPVMHTFLHTGWGLLLLTPSFYGLLLYIGLLLSIVYYQTRAPV